MTEPAKKRLKVQESELRDAVNSILGDDFAVQQDFGCREEHDDVENQGPETESVFYSEYTTIAKDSSIPAVEERLDGETDQVPDLKETSDVNAKASPEQQSTSTSSSSAGTIAGERPTADVNKGSVGNTWAVVAAHYNNLEEKGLDERNKSRIVHMRNFNNWMKSMLIDEYLTKLKESNCRAIRVLDMGCGKGGDLLKWRKGSITHLICADIAGTSVEQCKERYEDMKRRSERERQFATIFSAEFIVANCTKERLREQYKDVTVKLDLVSCQFAFHYCFESLPQAECMIRNASECLKPGGYFIGTCPNANVIVSRARIAGGKKFGNEIYSVEFETPVSDKDPPPLFGAKYNFHMEGVVDCPEFLVHFPTFIRLAKKFGLELVACEAFASFFDRMKQDGRGLLGKMQALETYPPFNDQQLAGSLSEYAHADKHLQETGEQRVGTLSVSEWEATTLYLAFAFKKLKTE